MKRLTAIFLVALMLLSNLITAFAEEGIEKPTEQQPYTLTVDVGTGGIVEVEGNGVVQTEQGTYTAFSDTEIQVQVTAENGYEIEGITLNDNPLNDTKFIMPEADSRLQITFQEILKEDNKEEGVTIPEIEDENKTTDDEEETPFVREMGRYASGRYQVTVSHEIENEYGDPNLSVGYIEIDNGKLAMCVCHEYYRPEVGTYYNLARICTAENKANELLRKVYYYGNRGPGDIGAGYSETVLAGSVANGHGDYIYNNYGQRFIDRIAGLPAAPEDFNVYILECGERDVQEIAYWEYIPKGNLEIQKASAIPNITNGNSCYSLQGAVYGLYKNGKEITRLTTDEKGYAKATGIKKDSYILKEITPPKGYALDKREYSVSINSKQTTHVDVKDYPQSDPVAILLGKVDRETTQNMPQGSATLEGAEFTIKYYDVQADTNPAETGKTPIRTWVLRTNEKGRVYLQEDYKVSGDDFYYMSNGDVTLPLGTITIQETKAPEGYLMNEEVFVRKIDTEGSAEIVETYNMPTVEEDIIRGDIQIAKYGESNDETGDSGADIKHPLEGINFLLTSKTTGDVYTITTDEQGIASTTQLGISDRGNLPFDTYIVSEDSPYPEYDPIAPFEVTIDTEGKTYYYIVRNDTVDAPISVQKVDAETGKIIPIAGAKFQVLDEDKNVITMTVSHYPTLIEQDTWETDANGGFILPETLEYGVYYLREIKAPEGYLLNGEDIRFVVDKEHQWDEPLTVVCKDHPAKGKIRILKTDEETGKSLKGAEFKIKAAENIMTPDGTVRAAAGTIIDTITSNQNGIAETKELYLGKYEVIETRQPDGYIMPENTWTVELTYKDQNTEIVIKELEAVNKPTHIIIDKKVTGTEEKLEGVTFKIWNKETDAAKEYVTNKDGKIDLLRFVPGTYCIQEVEGLPGYKWDDTIYEITIDENGLVDGKEIGNLTVKNSKTEITETNVIDVETGSQTIYPKKVKAVDTVSMVNLRKDTTYKLVSELRDVETGLPLREGNSPTGKLLQSEKEFVATDSAMDVEMDVSFDAKNFAGHTIVVFERLYEGDVEISTHTDLKDTKQQLRIMNPILHTIAIDVSTGTHEGIAKKDVTIRDNVKYENIISGDYILKGIVMDQQTGEPLLVNGKQVTSEKKVTITEENGTVDMDFTFDASELNNKSIVIYEYLHQEDELIASHEDINDKNQTVTFKVGSLKPNMPGHKGNGLFTALKTGDHIAIIPWILLALAGASIVITMIGLRQKEKMESKEKDNRKK